MVSKDFFHCLKRSLISHTLNAHEMVLNLPFWCPISDQDYLCLPAPGFPVFRVSWFQISDFRLPVSYFLDFHLFFSSCFQFNGNDLEKTFLVIRLTLFGLPI